MKINRNITLLDWLCTINVLSDVDVVAVKFPCQNEHRFTKFSDVSKLAAPVFLTAPIMDVWISKRDEGIAAVITVKPPKEYNFGRPSWKG